MATRTCGTCDGSGTFKGSTCQTCGGSGEIQAGTKEERKALGRKAPKKPGRR
jgi:DnaJ-class molecular chaperone